MSTSDRISVAEAAPLAGFAHAQGFYRAIREGQVPAGVYWRIGRDIHVSRSRLLAWIERGANAAPAVELDSAA